MQPQGFPPSASIDAAPGLVCRAPLDRRHSRHRRRPGLSRHQPRAVDHGAGGGDGPRGARPMGPRRAPGGHADAHHGSPRRRAGSLRRARPAHGLDRHPHREARSRSPRTWRPAVHRLRTRAIPVYNQQVYTVFTSRRFQTAALRMALRRVGVDPYYCFYPKGKQETRDYIVPLARVLQERKEEARLLPGIFRTEEPVFNVPRLGKKPHPSIPRPRAHRNPPQRRPGLLVASLGEGHRGGAAVAVRGRADRRLPAASRGARRGSRGLPLDLVLLLRCELRREAAPPWALSQAR